MKKYVVTVKAACVLAALVSLAGCMTAQDYVEKGRESSEIDEAMEYFDQALALEPYNAEIQKAIAEKYISEIKKNKGDKRKELFEKALGFDSNNPEFYYANGYALYVVDKDFRATGDAFMELVEKFPDYKMPSGLWFPSQMLGLTRHSKHLPTEGCSPLMVAGTAYYDEAKGLSGRPQNEKKALLERSLDCFLKGHDIDITRGQHNTQDAKTIYMLQIARSFELMEDYESAAKGYAIFLNDKSITFDKTGIWEKAQSLYAKVDQAKPAAAAGSSSNQQHRPTPIDYTGQTQIGFVGEVGGVYKLKFSSQLRRHDFVIAVPPYIKSVTAYTEGNLDTVIVWGGAAADLLELTGGLTRPNDMAITDNQSSTDRNARITFPTIPVSKVGRKLVFHVTEKNERDGTYILVIQGSR